MQGIQAAIKTEHRYWPHFRRRLSRAFDARTIFVVSFFLHFLQSPSDRLSDGIGKRTRMREPMVLTTGKHNRHAAAGNDCDRRVGYQFRQPHFMSSALVSMRWLVLAVQQNHGVTQHLFAECNRHVSLCGKSLLSERRSSAGAHCFRFFLFCVCLPLLHAVKTWCAH